MRRYCGDCGGRLTTETTNGGISRQVCENCDERAAEVFRGP